VTVSIVQLVPVNQLGNVQLQAEYNTILTFKGNVTLEVCHYTVIYIFRSILVIVFFIIRDSVYKI